jgi:hypothetical protein
VPGTVVSPLRIPKGRLTPPAVSPIQWGCKCSWLRSRPPVGRPKLCPWEIPGSLLRQQEATHPSISGLLVYFNRESSAVINFSIFFSVMFTMAMSSTSLILILLSIPGPVIRTV